MMDCKGLWFLRYEDNYSCALTSRTHQIMSKYKPIAPKPSFMSPNYSDSNFNSSSSCVVDSHFRLTTLGRKKTKDGCSNKSHKKVSYCSNSCSHRHQKRARVSHNQGILAFKRSQIVCDGVQGMIGEVPNIIHPFCGHSASEEKLIVNKDDGFIQKAAANAFRVNEFGRFNVKGLMNSIWEEPEKMAPYMPRVSTKCLVLGNVAENISDPEWQKEKESKEKNLVTLSLLPQVPPLKDSQSAVCTVKDGKNEQNVMKGILQCDREASQFRLFGRDFSKEEVGEI